MRTTRPFAWAAFALSVIAGAGPTEAATGRALYTEQCASCHGASMTGSEEAPPVVGAAFRKKWHAHVAALIEKIWRSMPQDDPGTLMLSQAEALAGALAQANRITPR